MTYAMSWPLQAGLYDLICTDPACLDTLGVRVFDAAPPGAGPGISTDVYMTFGDEEVRDWSSGSFSGAEHLVTISVHAPRRGFADAKRAAAAISDAILGGALTLTRGTVVNTRFVDAKTARLDADQHRRIDLRFRITIEDS